MLPSREKTLGFDSPASEILSSCLVQLYEIAHTAYRNKERVKMVIFPPGFHHNLLCKSPLLIMTVR